MDAKEFWDACDKFDWFYEMSDDGRVWRNGETARAKLLTFAPPGSTNLAIWNGFVKHHYSGEPWGTAKEPKPERPK